VQVSSAAEFSSIRVNSRPFAVVSASAFVGTYFSGRPFAVRFIHVSATLPDGNAFF
jgi:hypothetical protein